MAASDDPIKDDNGTLPESPSWGIKEDLLLACAVHRYGTNSWESVSVEIQKHLNPPSPVSPLACQHKFYDLHHRFSSSSISNSSSSSVPWLPELRKLRVAQLKREVQRYDLSIVSLQLKVKRLTEERSRDSDLQKIEHVESAPPAKSRPATLPGDHADQSVNGSNSTDPKGECSGNGPDHAVAAPGLGKGAAGDSTKPPFEGSYNGSSDSIAKQLTKQPEKDEDGDRISEPSHSPESERDKDAMTMKDDNSDVQSSVKSQPENEDQSPATKSLAIQSQPLADVLENVLSHRLGSLFGRRLESQDSAEYKRLIRQHIDLEMVKNRLEEGWYSDNHLKFFRDLLLLCNNALVFFQNKSSEWAAAIELQRLVFTEMSLARPKSDSRQSVVPAHLAVKPPPDQDLSGSLVSKQKGPLITCRKRSSITAKASTCSEKIKDQADVQVEKKQVLNFKPKERPLVDVEEQPPTKKRTNNERITYSSRNSAKNGKARSNNNNNNNNNSNSRSSDANLSKDPEHKVADKKNDAVAAGSVKKKDVANFLNRMKRGSSSDTGPLLESLKRSTALNNSENNNNKGGADRKRNNGSSSSTASASKDENARREQTPRRGSGGRQSKDKDEGSAGKRSVGRPARATALPPPPPPPPSSNKRNRGEASESEALPSSRQPKKRSRK